MKQILALYRKCKDSDSNFVVVMIGFLFWRVVRKGTYFIHQNVRINGIENIECNGKLEIGIRNTGFIHRTDKTYLNIKGKLLLKGNYSIGRGCRFDIGKGALVSIGTGGYTNCNTQFIIKNRLTIGDHCTISWGCQFLDDDLHEIDYEGKKVTENSIIIGNNVLIGCGVKIYKGTIIPDGCVISSDSVVRGEFSDENLLIGGHPATILKRNIKWS